MNDTSPWQRFASLATIVLVVAVLYVAQDLILPFALAALVTFMLAPIVQWLQRLRLPRVMAVVTSVLIALGAVLALGLTLVAQLDQLSDSLPQYRETIREKLATLGGTVADIERDLHDAMPDALDVISPGASPDAPLGLDGAAASLGLGKRPATPPVPVTVVDRPGLFEQIGAIAGPVLGPLGNVAVVFVLVLFMLMYLEDLRDRMVSLVNRRGVAMTTQAMSDVTQRISRYLLMTLVINTLYGVPVGIGLLLLGVPNALLWGLLATILRFIPYLGPWLAAGFPILLSFAISPGWTLTLEVTAMFLVFETISNNVVEPWIYGSRTGLSPLAIIVCALFWTWLWGMAGLLLAVPLTLIVVVSGRYVPSLRFLHTLLGDEPGLGTDWRFYQRLVAENSDEAERVAAEFLERRPLPELYDAVIVPTLRAAKIDEAAGQLSAEAAAALRERLADIMGGLPALAEKKKSARDKHLRHEAKGAAAKTGLAQVEAAAQEPAATQEPTSAQEPTAAAGVRVVWVPAGDPTGALVGPMLVELCAAVGIELLQVPITTLSSELVASAEALEPDVVIVAGLPPAPLARMRQLLTRLSAAGRDMRLIAAVWDSPVDDVVVGQAPRPRFGIGFGRAARGPTVLSEVRHRSERNALGSGDVAALIEAGAHTVCHTLAEAVGAVQSAAQQVHIMRAA